MKKIMMVLLALVLTSSIALADWQETFVTDYNESGLNAAVTNALAQGYTPEQIIAVAMAIEGVNGTVLASAMCDGGVPVQAMQNSLDLLGINQQTVMKSCGGGQGNISASGAFAGSGYSSAAKGTSQGAGNLGSTGLPPVVAPPTPPPASGSNFN